MKRLLTAVALATAALGANAQLTFSGGSQQTFTGAHDPTQVPTSTPGPTAGLTAGLRGATINVGSATTLQAFFLGKEALDLDTFTFQFATSGPLRNTDPYLTSISGPVAAGTLNLTFADLTMPSSTSGAYVILGSFDQNGAFTKFGGGYDLVLGYNDGLNVDGDYDDMVVGLRVAAIPEPETYALMLAGLGAIGFIARRRRRA